MPINHRYYFDLVTDLRRIVYCIVCENKDGAEAFYKHAQKIYELHILPHELRTIIFKDLENIWKQVMEQPSPHGHDESQKYADQLLTISSIIFHRIYPYTFSQTTQAK